MNVVVTGAFGNIGSNAVAALLKKGHRVRGISLDPERDRKVADKFAGRIEIVRGDVRSRADMLTAVEGQDVVVHLAYVIPPLCLEQPETSRSINVDGTRNVIEAVRRAGEKTGKTPRLLFASSLDVYGHTSHLEPPRRTDDPVQATDIYTQHKVECEQLVRESGLVWSMFRFADVPPIAIRDPHPIMFTIPLAQRFEVIHPRDAGLAVATAVDCEEVWGRVLNIGGGALCQVTYGQYLSAFLDAMGIGALPPQWFSTKPYCTDWLDSEESQRLLRYQRYGFQDIVRETAALMGWRRPLARALRPIVRWRIGKLAKLAASDS
ncbi:MAG TPA: NAD(P)-dependent oxidoreductase [Candidatus Limnocylindrales bacterium]|nr:NAD(P)-dependent oxidoreductase [Candidatus Limnocylindrales bacterium]